LLLLGGCFSFAQKFLGGHDPKEGIEGEFTIILNRGFVDLALMGGTTVLEKDSTEVVAEGIHSGHQDADIGCNTTYHYRIAAPCSQGLVEVGFEEGAEAPFRQYDVLFVHFQLISDLCAFGPPD